MCPLNGNNNIKCIKAVISSEQNKPIYVSPLSNSTRYLMLFIFISLEKPNITRKLPSSVQNKPIFSFLFKFNSISLVFNFYFFRNSLNSKLTPRVAKQEVLFRSRALETLSNFVFSVFTVKMRNSHLSTGHTTIHPWNLKTIRFIQGSSSGVDKKK